MNELIYLTIAGAAAAFKIAAILFGVIWAFQNILSKRGLPLSYRYTHAVIPYRSSNKHN